MKKFILALCVVALCACPARPKIISVKNGDEHQLTCEQLDLEIAAAQQAKLNAHTEDKFRASDIFPPTGVISVANIWRAHDHAVARLELLNKTALEKGCTNPPQSSNENYMVVAQYQPSEQSEIREILTLSPPENNAPAQDVATPTIEEEDPYTTDQNSDAYTKDGYDSEAFPRKDPKSAIRAVF